MPSGNSEIPTYNGTHHWTRVATFIEWIVAFLVVGFRKDIVSAGFSVAFILSFILHHKHTESGKGLDINWVRLVLAIAYLGFFEGKGHYWQITKRDLRDRAEEWGQTPHSVCVSVLGRSTHVAHQVHRQSGLSLTVGCLTQVVFHILPRNAHTIPLRSAFIFLVRCTVMADFLTDSYLKFFIVWVWCLFLFLPN